MPVILEPTVHDSIVRTMKAAFQDLPFYEMVIEPRIRTVILDAEQLEIDQSVHKRLSERYYNVVEFNKSESGKMMLTQIHIALRACYVLILTHHPDKLSLLWDDTIKLQAEYPEFQGEDNEELRYLLQFRNMMRLAILVVPPRMNKKLLINICARLEGSGNEYITGGGQKPCVTRRVLVYERECNVQAEKREERPRNRDPNQLTGKRRPQLNTSFKRLKLIRIASEEARRLVRNPDGSISRQNSFVSTSTNFGLDMGGHLAEIKATDSRVFSDLTGTMPMPVYRPAPPNFGRSHNIGSASSMGSYPIHPMSHIVPPPPPYVISGYQGYGITLPMPAVQFSLQASPYMSMPPPAPTMVSMTHYLPTSPQGTNISIGEEIFDFSTGILSRQQSEWINTFAESIPRAAKNDGQFPCGERKVDYLVASGSRDTTSGSQEKNSRETPRSIMNIPPHHSGLCSREISLDFGGNTILGDLLVGFDENAAIAVPMLHAISWDASSINFQEDLDSSILRDS